MAKASAQRSSDGEGAMNGRFAELEEAHGKASDAHRRADEAAKMAAMRADALEKERGDLGGELRRLEGEVQRLREVAESAKLAADRSGQERTREAAEVHRRQLAEQLERQRIELAAIEEGRRQLSQQQAEDADRSIAGMSQESSRERQRADALQSRVTELEAELMAGGLRAERVESAVNVARERERSLEAEVEAAQQALRRAEAGLAEAERRARDEGSEAQELSSSLQRDRDALREARGRVATLTTDLTEAQTKLARAEQEIVRVGSERDVVVKMVKEMRESQARSIAARRREQRRKDEEDAEAKAAAGSQPGTPHSPHGNTTPGGSAAGHQVRVHRSGSVDVTRAGRKSLHINSDGTVTEGDGAGGMDLEQQLRSVEEENRSLRARVRLLDASGGGGGGAMSGSPTGSTVSGYGGEGSQERMAQLKRLTESIQGQRQLDARNSEWDELRHGFERQVDTLKGRVQEAMAARDDALRQTAKTSEETRSARVRCDALDKERRRLLDEVSSLQSEARSGRQQSQLAGAQELGLQRALENEQRHRADLAEQLSRDKRLTRELQREAEEAITRAQTAEAQHDGEARARAALAAELDDLRSARHATDSVNVQMRGEHGRMATRHADLEEELARARRELTAAEGRAREADAALEDTKTRMGEIEGDRRRLTEEMEGASSHLRLVSLQKTQITTELEQVYTTLAELEKRLNETRAENDRLRRQLGLGAAGAGSAAGAKRELYINMETSGSSSGSSGSSSSTLTNGGGASPSPSPLPQAGDGSGQDHRVRVHRTGSVEVNMGGLNNPSHASAEALAYATKQAEMSQAINAPLPPAGVTSPRSASRMVASAVAHTEASGYGRTSPSGTATHVSPASASGAGNHRIRVHRTGSIEVNGYDQQQQQQEEVPRARFALDADKGSVSSNANADTPSNTENARAYLEGLKRRAAGSSYEDSAGTGGGDTSHGGASPHKVRVHRTGSVDVNVGFGSGASPRGGAGRPSPRSSGASPSTGRRGRRAQPRAADGARAARSQSEGPQAGDAGQAWMQGYVAQEGPTAGAKGASHVPSYMASTSSYRSSINMRY